MKLLPDIIEFVKGILDVSIITLGTSHLTLGSIFLVVILIILLIILSAKLKNRIIGFLVAWREVELGTGQAIGSIIHYIVIAIVFVIIAREHWYQAEFVDNSCRIIGVRRRVWITEYSRQSRKRFNHIGRTPY